MNENEFVSVLREALEGQVSPREIEEAVQFYRDYYQTKHGAGYGDEEIYRELGDPRLIANTIRQTSSFQPEEDLGAEDIHVGTEARRTKGHSFQSTDGYIHIGDKTYDLSKWYVKLGLICITILFFVVILVLLFFALKFFIYVVLPILLIVAIYKFIRSMF